MWKPRIASVAIVYLGEALHVLGLFWERGPPEEGLVPWYPVKGDCP